MRTTTFFLILITTFFIASGIFAQQLLNEETAGDAGVKLTWTATGDNDYWGTAAAYDIRYSTSYITETNWGSAIQAEGEPAPIFSGGKQGFYVSGLVNGQRYYFAMKVVDDAGNWSKLSNVASKVAEELSCGDVNGDGLINIGDEIAITLYVFHGPPPLSLNAADVNCDGSVNIVDAVYLRNFIFHFNAPIPCANCK